MKDYSNLASGVLAASAFVFDAILNDEEKPLERDELLRYISSTIKLLSHLQYELTSARRYNIINTYDEKAQKIMKKMEATTLLFDGKLAKLVENSKTLEKSIKELQPKKLLTQANRHGGLNWNGPNRRREPGGPGPFKSQQRKPWTPQRQSKPYNNIKRSYPQSQPLQRRY